MYKFVVLLKRPEGVRLEDFRSWWMNEHAPIVKRFSGLNRYAVNPAITADQPLDAMGEVWFETKEAAEGVFNLPEGQAALESATSHSSQTKVMHTVENVIVEG